MHKDFYVIKGVRVTPVTMVVLAPNKKDAKQTALEPLGPSKGEVVYTRVWGDEVMCITEMQGPFHTCEEAKDND